MRLVLEDYSQALLLVILLSIILHGKYVELWLKLVSWFRLDW
jgi:hypothetical protein